MEAGETNFFPKISRYLDFDSKHFLKETVRIYKFLIGSKWNALAHDVYCTLLPRVPCIRRNSENGWNILLGNLSQSLALTWTP